MTDVAINDELERLRAENAALEQRVNRRVRWRSSLSGLLLILGCGLAVLALVALWLRVTLLDTDRYVSTVAPIAAEPAVQDAVAKKLETAIFTRVDFASLAREVLPERADVLAPAIERGAQSVISDRIADFTRSDRFQQLWVEANRRAHTRVVELLEGGRSTPARARRQHALPRPLAGGRARSHGPDRTRADPDRGRDPTERGRPDRARAVRRVRRRAGRRAAAEGDGDHPAVARAAVPRRLDLPRAARGGAGCCTRGSAWPSRCCGLIALLAVGRSLYLDALGNGALPRDAASGIFDTLVAFLRYGVRVVVVVAVLVALLTFLAGLPLGRLFRRVWGSSQRGWVARNQRVLMLVTGGLGLVVLFAWSPLTGGVVLVTLLAVGIICGVIALLGLEPRDPVAEQLRADDQEQDGHDHGVVV